MCLFVCVCACVCARGPMCVSLCVCVLGEKVTGGAKLDSGLSV